jgi:WD40 repeat protein
MKPILVPLFLLLPFMLYAQSAQLAWIRGGLTEQPLSVCYSPDQRLIVTSGFASIKVWDANDRTLLHIRLGGAASSFSHDGSMLAAGSGGQNGNHPRITIWNTSTWDTIAVLTGHTSMVTGIAFSGNDSQIVSSSHDGTLRRWNIGSRKLEQQIKLDRKILSISADSAGAVIGVTFETSYPRVRLYSTSDLSEIRSFPEFSLVDNSALSPDGRYVAIGLKDKKTVFIHDAVTKDTVAIIPHTAFAEYFLKFSPDSKQLAMMTTPRSIGFWDIKDSAFSTTIDSLPSEIMTGSFSPDGQYVLVGSRGGQYAETIHIKTKVRTPVPSIVSPINDIALTPTDDTIYVATGDRRLWRVPAEHGTLSNYELHSKFIQHVIVADSLYVILTDTVFIIHRYMDSTVSTRGSLTAINDITIAGNGNSAAFVTGTEAHIWDADSNSWSILSKWFGPGAWLPYDGKTLYTNEVDMVYAWNISAGKPDRYFKHDNPNFIFRIVGPPSGEWIASASSDKTIRIWNPTTGELRHVLTYGPAVSAIDASTDGKFLASTDGSGQIHIWDIESGVARILYNEYAIGYISVSISSDGKRIYAGGADGTLIALDLNPTSGISTPSQSLTDTSKIVMRLTPNPISGSATIAFNAQRSGHLSIMLYDVTGRMVKEVFVGIVDTGDHLYNIDLFDLPQGYYTCNAITENGRATVGLMKEE